MSGSVFYYKIIIFGSKKAQSFTYSALLCSALLCSAVSSIAPRSTMSSSFSRHTPRFHWYCSKYITFSHNFNYNLLLYHADGAACPQAVYHRQAGRSLPSVDNFYALSVMLDTTVNDLIAERTHF